MELMTSYFEYTKATLPTVKISRLSAGNGHVVCFYLERIVEIVETA